jgi:glycosyltransferase involved in cell wall biosynthesis
MPRVTVCIAVYNGAETLARALDSIYAQTYKDFDVLFLDDGSKDQSADIAALYPCRIIRQENAGLGAARRRMIEEATGDLIAYMDHDDLWMPDKLEVQVPLHDDPEVVLSYTGTEWVQLDGSVIVQSETAPPGSSPFDHILPDNFIRGVATIFSREAMLEAGNIPPEVRIGSDLYGNYLLAGRGKFAHTPKPLIRFFARPGQNTEPSYRFFTSDVFLYRDVILKNFDRLFENAPPGRRPYYKRCIRQHIARLERTLAHYARTEKKDYRLAMGHHWRSVSTDPLAMKLWGSFLKNALLWRPG